MTDPLYRYVAVFAWGAVFGLLVAGVFAWDALVLLSAAAVLPSACWLEWRARQMERCREDPEDKESRL